MNLLNRVQGPLISTVGLVDVLGEQVAMSDGRPRLPIVRLNLDQLSIVFDGFEVVAPRRIKLSHVAQICDHDLLLIAHLRLRLLILSLHLLHNVIELLLRLLLLLLCLCLLLLLLLLLLMRR